MADSDDQSQDPDQDEWRFTVDDVGDAPNRSMDPETVDPFNAVFFLLGVGATLGLVLTVLL